MFWLDKKDSAVLGVILGLFVLTSLWSIANSDFDTALHATLARGIFIFFPIAGLYFNIISEARLRMSYIQRWIAIAICALMLFFPLSAMFGDYFYDDVDSNQTMVNQTNDIQFNVIHSNVTLSNTTSPSVSNQTTN